MKDLRCNYEKAKDLFSNKGQGEQEKTIVAGLLRVLGVAYSENELIKSNIEPCDITFGDASFQVTEILEPDRRRNLEIKKRRTAHLKQITLKI